MSLRVAVQMDPLEGINIAGDSTFSLMLAAQERGHILWHYGPESLCYDDGRVLAHGARRVALKPVKGDHFRFLTPGESLDLARDTDIVLLRQDPPFDMAYVSTTHLLERAQAQGCLVVNDPAHVRNAPEKLFVLDFADLMPPTMITRTVQDVRDFQARHGDVVIKPLYGNAGAAVFHLKAHDANLVALIELFQQSWREPFVVQKFLPDISKGDKRIILVDGNPVGAVNRLPKKGEIRSNLAVGGLAQRSDLTAREHEICRRLKPELQKRGLLFVGIDVIGGYLTEINVTSPTGIVAIDQFEGSSIAMQIWEAIEARRQKG